MTRCGYPPRSGLPLQVVLKIPTRIGDGDDLHLGLENAESDRHTTLKPDGPKAREDVVAAPATLGKRGERHAGFLDAIEIAACDPVAGAFRDVLIEADQVGFGFGAENDIKRRAWWLSQS